MLLQVSLESAPSVSGRKIVVCAKAVPEAASTQIDHETFRLDRGGETALNAPDRHAVEEAVRLKEAPGDGAEVVVLSMGPVEALQALRVALAMGADRAVLVSDGAAAGSDLIGTSRVLAAALEHERPDLVLFGQQAVDSNGAVLWAAVANRLRLPVVSRAVELELSEGAATVRRRTDRGHETIASPLPCVVAVSTAVNEPRIPSFRQLKRAVEKPCDRLGLADIGILQEAVGEQGSLTEVLGLADPPARAQARRIVDSGEAAEEILEYLVSRRLVL